MPAQQSPVRITVKLECPDPECVGYIDPEAVVAYVSRGVTYLGDDRDWECGYCGRSRRFVEDRR